MQTKCTCGVDTLHKMTVAEDGWWCKDTCPHEDECCGALSVEINGKGDETDD